MVNVPEGGGGGGSGGGGGHGGHGGHHGHGPRPHQMVLNPPFDHRMRSIGSPVFNPAKMKRGWIETAPNVKTMNYRVNFLFNPSELGVTHGISPDAPSPIQQNKNAAPGTQPYMAYINSSLSLSLLFDRTYELWAPSKVSYASKLGVYADVAAFYQYLGMIPKSYHGSKEISLFQDLINLLNPFDNPTPWETIYPQYPMVYMPSYLYIGPRLKFYGNVDNIAVTYTHWTHKMVPQRCKIDLSFQILANPNVIQGGGGGSDLGFLGNMIDLIGSFNPQQFQGTSYEQPLNVGAGVL